MIALCIVCGVFLLFLAAEAAAIVNTLTVGGKNYVSERTVSGNNLNRLSVSVPAAKIGLVHTRTDNDTCVLTMDGGHGFVTSNKVDVFWDGGSRRNMTATVSSNEVTVDGGSGDNLPAVSTAITAMVPTQGLLTIDGGTLADVVFARGPAIGWVVFVDDGPADIAAAVYRITYAGEGKSWDSASGAGNPLDSTAVTAVKFSHGEITAQVMEAGVVI